MISCWHAFISAMVFVVGLHLFQLVSVLDIGRLNTLYKYLPGECKHVPGIEHGSEDIHIVDGRYAFVSSGFIPTKPSAIFLLDLMSSTTVSEHAKRLMMMEEDGMTEFDMATFHPHGIDAWRSSVDNVVYVLVVNHHPDREEVLKFAYLDAESSDVKPARFAGGQGKMRLVKRIVDPSIKFLNDVAHVDDESFFFVNFFSSRNPLRMAALILLMFPDGSIGFYNGATGKGELSANGGVLIGNGVVLSPNGRFLYVAASGSRAIFVYAIHDDRSLKLIHQHPLEFIVDNLFFDVTRRRLMVGGQYVGLTASLNFIFKSETPSPSIAVSAAIDAGDEALLDDWRLELLDDGKMVDSMSVAARGGRYWLFGTVTNCLTMCTTNSN